MIKYQAYSQNLYFTELEPIEFKNGVQFYKAVVYEDHGDGIFSKRREHIVSPETQDFWVDKYGHLEIRQLIA